jgi:hypothetical protein
MLGPHRTKVYEENKHIWCPCTVHGVGTHGPLLCMDGPSHILVSARLWWSGDMSTLPSVPSPSFNLFLSNCQKKNLFLSSSTDTLPHQMTHARPSRFSFLDQLQWSTSPVHRNSVPLFQRNCQYGQQFCLFKACLYSLAA